MLKRIVFGTMLILMTIGVLKFAFNIEQAESSKLLISAPAESATDSDLIVNGTSLTLSGELIYNNVRIINGGILYVSPYNGSLASGWLNITANSILVDSTSKIDANAAGFPGGEGGSDGGQDGTDGTGPGCGYHGRHGSSSQHWGGGGGGGGYGNNGGKGGTAWSGSGGAVYGNESTYTIEMGSGGGGGGGGYFVVCYGGDGGAGGGAIVLQAVDITVDGAVVANGENGADGGPAWGGGGGGGSGGGILLDASGQLAISGLVSANGGVGGNVEKSTTYGGPGAGGRIKMFFGSVNITGITTVNGGNDNVGTIYPTFPDIAIINVTPSKTAVVQGYSVSINVTVANQGGFTETFNVTAYANTTEIDTLVNTTLASGDSTTLTFTWNTTGWTLGNYIISANASHVLGETDIADNTYVDGTVRVRLLIDVAVIDVTPSKTVVGQSYCMSINVTIENQGDFAENFNVTVYANTTEITAFSNITLTSGNSITMTFHWTNVSIPKGNYTISAYAWPVPGEVDIEDNTLFDGWVFVTIPGDVDGDFDVDIYDVVKITGIYHSKRGDPQFKPNSDLDCDGEIKIYDVVKCTSHYGDKDP